jgi:hypothetical protein
MKLITDAYVEIGFHDTYTIYLDENGHIIEAAGLE